MRSFIDQDVDIKFVAMGESHTAAISKNGHVYTWGHSGSGRLGTVTRPVPGMTDLALSDHVVLPSVVETLRGYVIVSISCGAHHTLFVADDGNLWASGCNMAGQLGTGNTEDRLVPVRVTPPQVFVKMAACGDQCSACIGDSENSPGELYTWGGNMFGTLGHGDKERQLLPKKLDSLLQAGLVVNTIKCGSHHMCAIADISAKRRESNAVQVQVPSPAAATGDAADTAAGSNM